ncbi:hypothetical protein DPV78_011038 [Talaromyces pinophilus]|nr:hypothetical protein DPV78_011038 [Talaromyces pinophilus]
MCVLGATFARAAIIPFDPATRAGRKKSDFPPNAANDSAGSVDEMRCNFPTLPQVSLQPMILESACARRMIESELMSIPPVTPGKLYIRIGSSDIAATCFPPGQ